MKKYIVIAVMFIFVSSSFAQSSKRTTAKKSTKAKTETRSKKSSTSSRKKAAKVNISSKSNQKAAKKKPATRSIAKSATLSNSKRSASKKSNAVSSKRSSGNKTSAVRTSANRSSNNRTTGNKTSGTRTISSVRNAVRSNSGTRTSSDERGITNTRINKAKDRKAVRNNVAHKTNSGISRTSRIARHKGSWNVKRPVSIEIRRVRYPYRRPHMHNVFWTRNRYMSFINYYPFHTHWTLNIGSQIESVSAYDAAYYEGEVKAVYGKVEDVFYSPEDRNYYLYFGTPFPYHDFSIVISRRDAKRISMFPEWYFENSHICVTGLITWFDDRPEIIVKSPGQIHRY